MKVITPGRMYRAKGNRPVSGAVLTMRLRSASPDGLKWKILAREQSRVQEVFLTTARKHGGHELGALMEWWLGKDVKKNKVQITFMEEKKHGKLKSEVPPMLAPLAPFLRPPST